jgi:hypothetical protein
MSKTWYFILSTVNTLKQTLVLQQGHKKNTQKKLVSFKSDENKTKKVNTTGLPPVKRFLYSHKARLRTFFFQYGQVS